MKANVAKVPVAKPSSSPEFVARPFLKRPSESSQRMWTPDLKMIKVKGKARQSFLRNVEFQSAQDCFFLYNEKLNFADSSRATNAHCPGCFGHVAKV